MPSITAYHGTPASFDEFCMDPPVRTSGHGSTVIGTFFSGSAAIAAHFAMKEAVVDAAYDHPAGSRSLLSNPYRFDDDPWVPEARLLKCALDLEAGMKISAREWVDLVEDGQTSAFEALRERALDCGCDHIVIEASPAHYRDSYGSRLSVEYDADTIIVFDPGRCRIDGTVDFDEVFPRSAIPRLW